MATRQGQSKSPRPATRGRVAAPKRSFPLIPALIGLVVLVAVIGGAIYAFSGPGAGLTGEIDQTAPGEAVPTAATRNHADGNVQYMTDPPTSGDHSGSPATLGFYRTQPPTDEKLVHNLEHGDVIIYWNPSKLDDQAFTRLKALYDDLKGQKYCVILAPRPTMDKAIALTSWGILATLDSFNEGAIRAFYRDHVARGPEFPEGQCG